MASIDIRSSAGQTDVDVGDLDSSFHGHGEDAYRDRCTESTMLTSQLPPLFLQLSVTLRQNGKVNLLRRTFDKLLPM